MTIIVFERVKKMIAWRPKSHHRICVFFSILETCVHPALISPQSLVYERILCAMQAFLQ